MKLNKAPGASGIKAEHLRTWMEGATKENEQRTHVDEWNMVVKLVKMAFSGDDIPSSFCNRILVLIPKNTSGEYRGIALLETIYKLVSSIINQRLIRGIQWHDSVHGFRKGRGTTTAIIEAKLQMELAQRSHTPLYMIFLDLKKAYDTLNRNRTMIILEKYGVGKNIANFITRIWEGDTIVPKQSGFYGKPFKATRGVRQGDIMSPTIFNIIVDAVIREWENKSTTNQSLVENLFYADDGLIMSENPEDAQTTLNIFTDGFARIGLNMNAVKTEAMVLQGGKIYGSISQEAYDRRATGVGTTHRERSLQKVQCELCGETVNRQHIPKHQQTVKCKNNRGNYIHHCNKPDIEEATNDINVETKHYNVSVTPGKYSECPVENCKKKEKSAGEMRRHFRNRHWNDVIEIQEEGLLPQCSKCLLFQSCVDEKHQNTLDCKRFTKIKDDREKAKVQQKAPQKIFYVNGTPIKRVKEFKYLGRILSDTDTDTAAMDYNLQRAREKWGRIGRILSKKSFDAKSMGTFYKTIIQSVLLYGSETWVISNYMMKTLRSFHRRCARYITGKHIWKDEEDNWHHPDSNEILKLAGLLPIEEYIVQRKKSVMKYIGNRPIYEKCLKSKPIASKVNQIVWWTN